MNPGVLRGRLASRSILLAVTMGAAGIELLPSVPGVLLIPAGLWLLLFAPVVVWYAGGSRVLSTPDGRVLLAVGLAILTDMTLALAASTLLPGFGVSHPLARRPLTLTVTLVIVALAAAVPVPPRGSYPVLPGRFTGTRHRFLGPRGLSGGPRGLRVVLAAGTGVVILSIAGAFRLNNGLSGTVSFLAVLGVAALLVVLLVRRRHYPTAVVETGLFLAATALLLLTSLRGWYIAGHDIQLEYQIFQLTLRFDRWEIAAFRDPYNACLSITLLPAALVRLTGIPGLLVFKALLPVLFAFTPVLVYRSVRNVGSQMMAMLSALYFMMFPTFFTDMTFLVRQEIAFILLGCAMVVATDVQRPVRNRRVMFTVLLLGIVLAHYSTTYVVIFTLGLALCVDLGWRLLSRRAGRRDLVAEPALVTAGMIAVTAAAAALWAGPVTHTGRQLGSTVTTTGRELLGQQTADGSSDTVYSLVGGQRATPSQRLDAYRAETTNQEVASRTTADYLPADLVDAYPAVAVVEPGMPLTALGTWFETAGLDVRNANRLIREGAARLLQALLLLGLLVTLLARHKSFRPSRDQLTLSLGSLGVLVVLTIAPRLSADYGVLRAFQQGLLFFAPFIAVASLWIFRWAGRRATAMAGGMALLLFLDLTGAVPKLLGGYPAQLQLSNSGQYYDIHYVHPEERAAFAWLLRHTTPDESRDVQTDRLAFGRPGNLVVGRSLNDVFPTRIGVSNYVLLGFTTIHGGKATIFYNGDLVTYRYPIGLLDATKDKIYSSTGAGIYR